MTNYSTTSLVFRKNGAEIGRKKISAPDSTQMYLEFGAGGRLYDITFEPSLPQAGSSKSTTTSPAFLSAMADTSPTVTGGFVVVSTTDDLAFNVASGAEDFGVAAQFTYTKTAGAAVNFTPQAKLQYSTDRGASWADVGSPVVGAASTGTQQSLNVSATQSVSNSGTRRYRLLVKNTVAGAYTVTCTGFLNAQWLG